jgi:hypothetical protein
MKKILHVLPAVICSFFAITAFLGWWVPNQFGTGGLWTIIFIMYVDKYMALSKEEKK